MSIEFQTDAVKCADDKILRILEREGMFKWLDDLSERAKVLAQTLELLAIAELSVTEPMNAETNALLKDLKETLQLGDSSVAGRENTKDDYINLARTTGLKTFTRLSGIYKRQHDDAVRVHEARKRIISGIENRPVAP